MREAGMGLMLTPRAGLRLRAAAAVPAWAADTGCFKRPEAFDLERYFAWLSAMEPVRERCLFATAPDVVGDATATWERSAPVLPRLRAAGFRAALVAQDGIEAMRVEWSAFDVLFIGGTTSWKLSDAALVLMAEARRRGKWVHMGRVNSRRRLRFAHLAGCHSADGTYASFNPHEAITRMGDEARRLALQPPLFRAELLLEAV
jgi:hypothetical protein